MGNWTLIVHGVGQHGVYPPRTSPKNIEQQALEIVEKLRAEGQSVSDCVVVAGAASGLSGATRTALGMLESYDARGIETAPAPASEPEPTPADPPTRPPHEEREADPA